MITAAFGIRVHLRPFAIEPYAMRLVDGEPVEKLRIIPIANPDAGQGGRVHDGGDGR